MSERARGRESSSHPGPVRPGTQHPLMGARLEVLARALLTEGGVSPRHAPLATAMALSAIARAPFRAIERVELARRRRRAPPLEPPVFILGHWRSGTTHLHNLLGRSPSLAIITPLTSGIPDEMLTLGTWLRPLLERALPENRHVDRVAVRPQSPQEDEIPLANMGAPSIYNGLYFPSRLERHVERGVFLEGVSQRARRRWSRLQRHLIEKVAIDRGRPRVLVKNVVYTARVALLREMWPEARFIFIRRNPYEVYASTLNYYRKLLPMLALQRFDHVEIERLVLETYPRLMDRYLTDREGVPRTHLAETSYEELVADPLATLGRLHEQLGLEGWEAARPRIEAYLDSVSGYQRNSFTMEPADAERVERAWGRYIDLWGYERPGAENSAHVRLVERGSHGGDEPEPARAGGSHRGA